ncbi:alpha/beta hydrolase [Actinocorallia sp. B10E7]|uniref:alpha/beta hydrolase n=1 Tax=Actinocorallia sp. B10E7 TaxID=3153558 RepID=UPI00325C3CC0
MTFETISFGSGGVDCRGWLFRAAHDELATEKGRPCVVMAHGLAGTMDSGLEPFATALTLAGLDVLAFDYRGFGLSSGTPRQIISIRRQHEDYRAAMAAAAGLPGVDPNRLVLWGVSLAGGHVLSVAAGRKDVAAVVALTPLVDGAAAGRLALSSHPKSQLLGTTALGLRAYAARAVGSKEVMMPVVGKPGSMAALTLEGAEESYLAIAGPSWRNRIGAAITVELGSQRSVKDAAGIACPVLFQIADFDRSAPPYAALKAAVKARAEVRHYPCDHFDVYQGADWHTAVVSHQVHFLTRHLMPTPLPTAEAQ